MNNEEIFLNIKELPKPLSKEETYELFNKLKMGDKNAKNIYDEKLEFELSNLYKELENYEDYNNYLKYAKKLNEIITTIQKNFEDYFNKFVIQKGNIMKKDIIYYYTLLKLKLEKLQEKNNKKYVRKYTKLN